MSPLTNPAFIIFTLISPMLIAVLKQQGFSKQINALIALVGYIVVGAIGALTSGVPLTLDGAVAFITVAVTRGTAAYSLIWTNLGVDTVAASLPAGAVPPTPSIEARLTAATSIVKK